MKRVLLSVFLTIAMLGTVVLPSYAIEPSCNTVQNEDGSTVIYYDDGSHLTISPVRIIGNDTVARATTQTKNGLKDVKFTDSDGNVEWKYTLSATFSYVYGSSVSCTSAKYSNNIYDNAWSFSNGSATKSGGTAYGRGHYAKKVLFVTVKNIDIDISITCDKYGNLS